MHVEAAKILSMKGADLTDKEKTSLGRTYTNFLHTLQKDSQREDVPKEDQKRHG